MSIKNYECEGQLSLSDIADKPLKFHEAEWLRAKGYKNIYDEQPPKAGWYEFTDIEYPTKTKQFEVTENGGIMFNNSDFKARWWRPIESQPEEPIYELDIVGICDDPVCPNCGYEFETTRTCKNYEVDCERCPECHVKVDWTRWHRINDDEPQA